MAGDNPIDAAMEKLQGEIETLRARVRVGFPLWLRPLLHRGVIGLALGRTVYLDARVAAAGKERVEALLRHELQHVRQVARLGLIRFLILYLRSYLRLRGSGLGHHEAYRGIEFEQEAFEAERAGSSQTATSSL
ncbi:MAG TPA: hypothetical protein VM557_08475 [Thermoanaerobaculia bacterium]|nr:hypothetical protein [Thermoanaerobaculia bacterium]